MSSTPTYVPTGFAHEIFSKRYGLHDKETFAEAADRTGTHVAMAESGENIPIWKTKFSDAIKNGYFMPGGRILYGSGRPKGQLLNCFVVPTADSREGWGKTTSDMIIITGTGGGLGVDFSPVRPRGTKINGSGGEVIKAGGGRRTALMFSLGLSHGDILEFLDKKLDLSKLNNANVSVMFDEDPEDFFRKVKKDLDFNFIFRGQVVGTVKAKELWHKIVGMRNRLIHDPTARRAVGSFFNFFFSFFVLS